MDDKSEKIRPASDMFLGASPPRGYCDKYCTLCGPRVVSDYEAIKPPGKINSSAI
jgi:hypothetical protein